MKFIDSLLEGKVILRTREAIERQLAILARKMIFSHGEVNPFKIFVMTYDNGYTCNPSYIIDEIVRRNLPVEIVFVTPSKGKPRGLDRMPSTVKKVKRGSAAMFKEQATSKIWIDNALNCVWYRMPKKKSQVYINTWHGSLGIKKLSGNKHWLRIAKQCKKKTDYCVTNSVFEENVFRQTFWPTTPFLKFGHARNDILFDQASFPIVSERVRSFYGIDPEKKILLYAPTFRDNGNTSCFNLNYEVVKNALEDRFSGQWVILARMHFKNRSLGREMESNDWFINATDYPEMQDLLVAADAGITDYSSWAYDYVLTRKPLYLYTPDISDYDQERGFYYNLDTTPFPRAETNDDLVSAITSFDNEEYLNRVDTFLQEKGCYETGHAASLVVDKIEEILGI
ncbi:CDP-glycerol glycerophosphotransferase family protein [uncultured Bifidobacterium sp.]|uniref:CDP-glycerol glycerophosphotransferase family protein n=1 Tax=uncultured Bifidobacterium sp. TaxID=165187 RepID=UPI00258C40A7|nr:CDP-glycerol glycerophosphotransferase family protein [uncultured Bifidobacterium sp.]